MHDLLGSCISWGLTPVLVIASSVPALAHHTNLRHANSTSSLSIVALSLHTGASLVLRQPDQTWSFPCPFLPSVSPSARSLAWPATLFAVFLTPSALPGRPRGKWPFSSLASLTDAGLGYPDCSDNCVTSTSARCSSHLSSTLSLLSHPTPYENSSRETGRCY